MRLSLLIPVYGSASILEEGYAAFRAAAAAAAGEAFELVYLVDGSLDDSSAILARVAAADPHVRVRTRQRSEGLGATLVEDPGEGQGPAVAAALEGADGICLVVNADLPRAKRAVFSTPFCCASRRSWKRTTPSCAR